MVEYLNLPNGKFCQVSNVLFYNSNFKRLILQFVQVYTNVQCKRDIHNLPVFTLCLGIRNIFVILYNVILYVKSLFVTINTRRDIYVLL